MLFICCLSVRLCSSHHPSVWNPSPLESRKVRSHHTGEANSGVTCWLFVHVCEHMPNPLVVEGQVLFKKLQWKPATGGWGGGSAVEQPPRCWSNEWYSSRSSGESRTRLLGSNSTSSGSTILGSNINFTVWTDGSGLIPPFCSFTFILG